MTTKTYKELNTELSSIKTCVDELNKQIAELSKQKEELTKQIKLRRQQVIENYIQQVNQMLETQKEMMEMGIDPTNIDMTMGEEQMTESAVEVEQDAENIVVEADTPMEGGHVEVPMVEPPVEDHQEEVMEEVLETHTSNSISSISLPKDEFEKILSTGKMKPQLLAPLYYAWGFRKGEFDLTCSTPDYKNTSHKLQNSFMEQTHSPNETILLGNEKYRDSYPTPDEGRVYSAYGIAPTLTRMHSNILVEIGNPPHVDKAA